MVAGSHTPTRERLPLPIVHPEHDIPLGDRTARLATALAAGTLTENRPVEGRTIDMDGARAATFFDDYYNRIHVIPPFIDFGSIAGAAVDTVRLWNARLSQVTLTAITSDDSTQGVTLTGSNPPRVMKSLAVISYNVVAAADGPADIDLGFTFAFNNGEQPRLPVSGVRAALFPFAPNWRDSYRVSYEYKTDIFTSRSGREQRRAARTTPRKRISFKITLPDSGPLNRFMTRSQHHQIVLPDMSRQVIMLTGIPEGGQEFEVDAVPNWIAAGMSIMVGGLQRKVDSVTGNLVRLHAQVEQPVAAGETVNPAVFGRLTESVKAQNITDRVVEADIEVALTPGAVLADDEGTPREVFNGREVFLFEPNWVTPIQGSFEHPVDTLDFGRGRIVTYTPIVFDSRIRQVQVLFPTQGDRAAAVAFFSRMKGQRGEFYMPTWENDLVIARPAEADTQLVWVAGREIFDTYAGSTTHCAIVLRNQAGHQFFRRITNITTDNTDTLLETDIPWPEVMDDRIRLSWLLASRFGVDQIEMECITDEVGRAQLTTRALEDLTVADDENPWAGLSDGAQWMIDRYGWDFTKTVIGDPFHFFVHHVLPPWPPLSSGAQWMLDTFDWYFTKTVIGNRLHYFLNTILPES